MCKFFDQLAFALRNAGGKNRRQRRRNRFFILRTAAEQAAFEGRPLSKIQSCARSFGFKSLPPSLSYAYSVGQDSRQKRMKKL